MKFKRLLTSVTILLLTLLAFVSLAQHDAAMAAQDSSEKIENLLLDRFATDGSADFIVRFTEQADLSAAYSMDWDARGDYVYNTLRDTASNSQVNAKGILDAAGIKYQTFIAGNDLYVWNGTLADANALAVLPEVYFIRATRIYQVDPGLRVENPLMAAGWAGDLLANHALTTVGASPDATTAWGITDTKADQFWTTFGMRGEGVVVANIDTGVDYTHVALYPNYKCAGNPSDPACWLDPSPSDCNGPDGGPCDSWVGTYHGTHVMGTQAGDDDPSLTNWVGMAPSSQWIACLGCPSGSCPDYDLNACADWILAPNGDPANRPNVVNNSWGGGGGNNWWLSKVQAWVSAGVFPAFSAGNSGSSCSTLGSPGDYQESFGSAAHDSSRNIASFSSRGPSAFGHEPYTKPNISSPGVNVYSAMPGDGWQYMSGTSMASPHTAGAVALLYSCNPALIGQIDMTFQILQSNTDVAPAGNCGAPPDNEGNYTFGYGYLDVLSAGISVCGGVSTGHLQGYVYDQDGLPLQGASVNVAPGIEGNEIQAITDPNGYYTMTVVVGTYNATASKQNYTSQTVTGINIISDTVTSQDFSLTFLGAWLQISPLPTGCPDFTRLDAEYYPGNGLVYILGGRGGADGGSTFGDVYSYDLVANTCTDTGTNMPTPVSNYTIALVNDGSADLLCIFGGRDAAGGYTANYQCYDPLANTATTLGTLPGELPGFIPGGVGVYENKVYVFGGFRNTTTPYHTAQSWEWDPLSNTWTQKGDVNLGRGYINVAVVDGLIYGIGGDTFDGTNLVAQTIAEVFDPVAGTWDDAAVADLPTATGEGRAYGFDTSSPYDQAGKIIIAGGGQWPADTVEVFSYNVVENTYDYSFPDLNTSRRNAAGFFVPGDPKGAMWVFGGRCTGGLCGGDLPPYGLPEYYEVNIVTPQPNIKVTWPSLDVILQPDAQTTQVVKVENIGTLPLEWSISEVPLVDWLGESPASGTIDPGDPAVEVVVTFDSGGLAPGVYGTELQIVSNDPDTPLKSKPALLTVKPEADLAISKADAPDPVFAGHPLTYTLAVNNLGPDDAPAVVVTDNLPAGVTFDHANPPVCSAVDLLVTCDLGDLPFGDPKNLEIVAIAPSTAGTITNTATIEGDVVDLVPGNNTATAVTTVEIEPADLVIIMEDSPDPVRFGEVLTYTLIVSNMGTNDATGVKVVDNLPSGVTFDHASPGCGRVGLKVTCNIGDLAADEVIKVIIVVHAPEVEGTITNTAIVSANEPDPVPDNNTASADTMVIPTIYDFYLPIIMK